MSNMISRRTLLKGFSSLVVLGMAGSLATGCGSKSSTGGSTVAGLDLSDWDAVVEAAKGTKVIFAGFGGMDTFNSYMENTAIPAVKEKYDIELVWNKFDVESDIVALVNNEKSGGKEAGEGSVDLMWITLNESATMQDMGSLYEDVRQYIPTVAEYIDPECGGMAGLEKEIYTSTVPWGPLHTVYVYDSSKVTWTPKNAKELLEWCKEYKGKMSYPVDYGESFWWPLLIDVIGEDWYKDLNADSTYDEVKAAMEPGLEYLRELNPYLWNKGKSYPHYGYDDLASGEVWNTFMDTPYVLDTYVDQKVLPDTMKEFVFEDIGVYEWWGHQIAIPYNCTNIAGAMCVMDALFNPEQAYAEEQETGYEASLDPDRLDEEGKKLAESVHFSKRCISKKKIESLKKIDPAPADIIDTVYDVWRNEVAGKYND